MVEQKYIDELLTQAQWYFQNLKYWSITYGELRPDCTRKHLDKCWHKPRTMEAHIYPKSNDEDWPQYIFHEMIHIALSDLRVGSHKRKIEKEEIFVQDLCRVYVEKFKIK